MKFPVSVLLAFVLGYNRGSRLLCLFVKKKFAPRGEESSSNSKSCAFGLEKNIEAVPLG